MRNSVPAAEVLDVKVHLLSVQLCEEIQKFISRAARNFVLGPEGALHTDLFGILVTKSALPEGPFAIYPKLIMGSGIDSSPEVKVQPAGIGRGSGVTYVEPAVGQEGRLTDVYPAAGQGLIVVQK